MTRRGIDLKLSLSLWAGVVVIFSITNASKKVSFLEQIKTGIIYNTFKRPEEEITQYFHSPFTLLASFCFLPFFTFSLTYYHDFVLLFSYCGGDSDGGG